MRTIHYKTLKGFMRANGIRQFTLEDFRSGRIYSSRKGLIKFKLSEEAENEYVRGITGVIWSKFDIINGLNQFADRIKALAERIRKDKPEAAGYLDEAHQRIGGAYIALNTYLEDLV